MKIEQAVAALRFDPAIPAWAFWSLAALCALTLAPAILRRARGWGWRALAFAVLLAWLANPRLIQETRDTLADIALLVVDQSQSMQVRDRAALRDAARLAVEDDARRQPGLELRTVLVPEGHDGTQLFAAIERALGDIPRSRLSSVIALTDGMVHDVPETFPVPLHVLIPARGEETDRRLRVIEAPSFGVVGRSVTLRVAIDDLGVTRPAATARLTIRRDGEPPEVLDVPIGREQPVEVPITRAGPIVVELLADALPGEASLINNRAIVTVNGVRDRLRVLLVSGEPHQGERTWRRLLKADPSVDLVHFTILRPPERDDLTPLNELALIAFPVRELFQVKIRDFDLIILDRFQNRGILPPVYLRNIADYVRAGGGLLLSAGPEFSGTASLANTPLGSVLSAKPLPNGVVNGAFRPQIPPAGQRHPVTSGLPGWMENPPTGVPDWGSWYRRIGVGPSASAPVMVSADGAPLLLLDHVGEGRTAMLLSDQIWLWSRGHEGGGPQAELLRRIAHWLMKEPALEEESLRAEIVAGVLRVERHTMQEGPPPDLTVTTPDGRTSTIPLSPAGEGRSTAEMPAADLGVWRVSDGTNAAFAAAQAGNKRESEDLRATATVLAPLVKASGGSSHFLAASDGVHVPELRRIEPGRESAGPGWIGLPRRHDHVVTGVTALPLLPPWAALPILLGLVLLAWRREGSQAR